VFTTRISDFCFDSTYRQSGTKGILCSYSIGDKADDLGSETNQNNVKRWITDDMVDVTGADPKTLTPVAVFPYAWQKVPWIGGAYAFYRPGQWFTVQKRTSRLRASFWVGIR